MYGKLLLATPDEVGVAEAASRIEASSRFALELVSDLLDVAAIESGRLELRAVPTDLLELTRDCLESHALLARARSIEVSLSPPRSPLPKVPVDPRRYLEILSNLLGNAVRFSGDGRPVRVSLDRQGDEVVLEVADEGPGIPLEEQGRLFEPFVRGSVDSSSEGRSTGLGLAIVSKLARHHRGRGWVESEPGRGSRFFVALPLEAAGE